MAGLPLSTVCVISFVASFCAMAAGTVLGRFVLGSARRVGSGYERTPVTSSAAEQDHDRRDGSMGLDESMEEQSAMMSMYKDEQEEDSFGVEDMDLDIAPTPPPREWTQKWRQSAI